MNAETPTPTSPSGPSWEPLGDGREVKSELRAPLFTILTQINIAADNGLDLLAISMAVAMPDICVSLISDDGRSDGAKYKDWCAANLKEDFTFVTGDDLWSMRCGVLHNGRFGGLKHNVARVVFLPKNPQVTLSNCRADDAYLYSVDSFCLSMNRAVVAWYEANHQHPNVVTNMERIMQYRSDGARGIGLPMVIA